MRIIKNLCLNFTWNVHCEVLPLKVQLDFVTVVTLKAPEKKYFSETHDFVCLFDSILYVPSTIFQLNRNSLPGLNQY